MAEYLKSDIARILNKRPGTIEYYTTLGLVVPDIEPSQGKGVPRVYSSRNLLEFGMIEVMSRLGVPLSTIQIVLGILRKGEWVPENVLVEAVTKSSTQDALKQIQEEKVSFKDFWTSDEWGSPKELFYVTETDISPSGELCFGMWMAIQENPGEEMFVLDAAMTTVLWLGRIKKAAARVILK